MDMWGSFAAMAARYGLPAVILVFWYLHNQQQAALFRDSLQQQKDQDKQMVDMVRLMIEQQQRQAEQHFTQTERMLEDLQFLCGQMNRVENKIDTNQSCPLVREGHKA